MKTALKLLAAGMIAALPAAAFAQPAPSYAVSPGNAIHGTIAGFDGKYGVQVNDARGYVDRVQLHDGTVINPTGLRLQSGMKVTILGHAAGGVFIADEVDTPYHFPRYYAYGYPPAPLYAGYPYGGYPYGPWYGPGPYFNGGIGFWIR